MNNSSTIKLPIKNHGRTAHHKPNAVISMQTSDHKPQKKRDHTPPISNPLSSQEYMNRSSIGTTNMEEINKTHRTKFLNTKSVEVQSKVTEMEKHTGLKASPRFMNKTPVLEKKDDFAYFNLDNVPKTHNEQEFKRFLWNNGVNPVSVKLYQHPINNTNNGKGFLVINRAQNREVEIRNKLESNGIGMVEENKLKRFYNS